MHRYAYQIKQVAVNFNDCLQKYVIFFLKITLTYDWNEIKSDLSQIDHLKKKLFSIERKSLIENQKTCRIIMSVYKNMTAGVPDRNIFLLKAFKCLYFLHL